MRYVRYIFEFILLRAPIYNWAFNIDVYTVKEKYKQTME